MINWQNAAIKEGRICPECKQPVSKKAWIYMNKKFMHKQKKIDTCYTCKLAHWDYPIINCGGDVMKDNADRDAYNEI